MRAPQAMDSSPTVRTLGPAPAAIFGMLGRWLHRF